MMRAFTTRRLRWAVPAGVAAAVAAASLTSSVVTSAAAEPTLPARTAAQLLASLEQINPAGFSGTIVETAKLGLPSLPDIATPAGGADLSLANLVTGAHTLRVWYGGQEQQRLALLGQLSETDVIHNGKDLWSYSSTTREVTHTTLTPHENSTLHDRDIAGMTPQAAAEAAVKAIDPTTTVGVDTTARVAGRAAYQLVLSPKDTRSLIGSVRIAIDSQTSVPLRVQVFARGATSPAIQVGFTDVSFTSPDPSVFQFVQPAGSILVPGGPLSIDGMPGASHVVERGVGRYGPTPAPQDSSTQADSAGPTVLGHGWTAVAEFHDALVKPGGGPAGPLGPSSAAILNQIATPVAGGQLVTSSLFSIFITDDGRVFVGAVSGDAIQQVASTGHGL